MWRFCDITGRNRPVLSLHNVAFSTGISIPIPSAVQIALCSRWYCYLAFVSRGMQKNVHGTNDENLPALATYLPTSPSTAKSRTQRRRGGRGGSPISRPVLFLLRSCADVRFSVRTPPKPAGDLKILPRASVANLPRALRARPHPPPEVAQNGCVWLQNGHKTGRYQNGLVTFSRAPA